MSHIHEALKKAQKDRVRNLNYSGILAASRRKRRSLGRKTIRWAVPLIIMILLAFFYNLWLNFRGLQTPDSQEKDHRSFQAAFNRTGPERSRKISPEKAQATRPGESQPVGPVRPQGIEQGTFKTTKLGAPQAIKPGEPTPVVQDDPETTYERARRFHKEGRIEEAKRLYEETLRLDPGHVDSLNNLGVIFLRKRDYLSAQRSLGKAVRLKPRYAEPYYNLACLNAITGDTKKAMAYLQKAVSLDPTVRDWAQRDTDLETLRQLPEFKELI